MNDNDLIYSFILLLFYSQKTECRLVIQLAQLVDTVFWYHTSDYDTHNVNWGYSFRRSSISATATFTMTIETSKRKQSFTHGTLLSSSVTMPLKDAPPTWHPWRNITETCLLTLHNSKTLLVFSFVILICFNIVVLLILILMFGWYWLIYIN